MLTVLIYWVSAHYGIDNEGIYWGTVFMDITIIGIFGAWLNG